MQHHAVDSFGIHTPASARALADAGVRCALRYCYNTSRNEVALLHDHGIGYCLIAEFDTRAWHPALDSPATGTEHAHNALAVAHKIGLPPGAKITFTVDTMVWPGDLDRVRYYFDLLYPPITNAGYLVDAYGGSFVIDDLVEHGLADTSWEAAARTWSSPNGTTAGYRPSRTAHLRQLVESPTFGGVECDLNVYVTDPVGEWMPDGTISGGGHVVTPTEDPMANKVVFCRDHTGDIGWRVVIVNGRRYRESYSNAEDFELDLTVGATDGQVDLTGDAAGRFLWNYAELPAIPADAVRLVTCAPDTPWARNVAGLGAGEHGRFLLSPNRYLIRVRDDNQWNSDRYVGVPDAGEVAEPFLYNQPLMPWALPASVLDPVAMAAAINVALDDVHVDANLSPAEIDAIAGRVVTEFASTVHFDVAPVP